MVSQQFPQQWQKANAAAVHACPLRRWGCPRIGTTTDGDSGRVRLCLDDGDNGEQVP
uniref:Uncharacterized protein n=1 Tax=Arundo donax TaxID=35708 RepID=A0A0A9CCR3_ARUDO